MRQITRQDFRFDTELRCRALRAFAVLALVGVVLASAAPVGAQDAARFDAPPWPGGWSDGGQSTTRITVWRQDAAASREVTVAVVWALGVSADATSSELQAVFNDATEAGSVVQPLEAGQHQIDVDLAGLEITGPGFLQYALWITVDGVAAAALDVSQGSQPISRELATMDVWTVWNSFGFAGPLTDVSVVEPTLAIDEDSASFSGDIALQPTDTFSTWRTFYQYRVLLGETAVAGPTDFEGGVAYFGQNNNADTVLPAPWDWNRGDLDLVVEVGRYDSNGDPIAPEENEFGASGNTAIALAGCGELAAPTGLSADPQSTGSSPITWDAVPGATGYLLRVATGGQEDLEEVDGTSHSYDFTAGLTYQIGVRAFAECAGRMRSYGDKAEITTQTGGPPQVSFIYEIEDFVPAGPPPGFTVTFVDQTQGLDPDSFTWSWDFGDGGTSTQQNPVHPYARRGCYSVMLTVTNTFGSSSHSDTVHTEVVAIGFDWIRDISGDAIVVNATAAREATTNFSWQWRFGAGDGSPTDVGASSTVTLDPGVHPVTLTGTHCGGEVLEVTRNVSSTLATEAGWTVADEFDEDTGSAFIHLIPAGARAPGAGGANWASDMAVLNPGDALSEVRLYLLGSANNATRPGRRLSIAADASVKLEDFFGIFAVNAGTGGVLAASNDLLVITSRTFNADPDGTFGQFIPAVPILEAVREGEVGRLIQLTQDGQANVGGFRTNVGVLNVTAAPLEVNADLSDAEGNGLGSLTRTLPPFAYYQWNQIFGNVDSVTDAYALIQQAGGLGSEGAVGDNAFFTYASVVDNLTADPVYIGPPRRLNADRPGYFPASAKAAGLGGSFWRTDLEVHNPGPGVAMYRLALLETGKVNSDPEYSPTKTLDPDASERFPDVLGTLFVEYEGSAALRVEVIQGGVMATSRTYTDVVDPGISVGGTYGQYIPCYPVIEGVRAGDAAYIPQLAEFGSSDPDEADYGGFRTNVGFVNLTGTAMAVRTVLYDGDGVEVGRRPYNLRAYEHKQFNQVFGGGAGIENGYAVVLPAPGAALGDEPVLLAYASVVDNRSSDPVYIPARSLLPVADFSWTPEKPGPGENVYFVDRSLGYPTQWSWFFGEGGTLYPKRDQVYVFDESGEYDVSLEVDGGVSEAGARVTVSECMTPIILTPASLEDGTVGEAYYQTITASGGLGGSYVISQFSGDLPSGLTLVPETGNPVAIQGTPTVAGESRFALAVTGGSGCADTYDYTIEVGDQDQCELTISATALGVPIVPDQGELPELPTATVGDEYDAQEVFIRVGPAPGDGARYSIMAVSGMPGGLRLDQGPDDVDRAKIVGTPGLILGTSVDFELVISAVEEGSGCEPTQETFKITVVQGSG